MSSLIFQLISKVMGLNPVLVLFRWFLINRTWTKQHFFALVFLFVLHISNIFCYQLQLVLLLVDLCTGAYWIGGARKLENPENYFELIFMS